MKIIPGPLMLEWNVVDLPRIYVPSLEKGNQEINFLVTVSFDIVFSSKNFSFGLTFTAISCVKKLKRIAFQILFGISWLQCG